MKQSILDIKEGKERNNMTYNFVRVPTIDCLIPPLTAERLDEMSFQLKGEEEE